MHSDTGIYAVWTIIYISLPMGFCAPLQSRENLSKMLEIMNDLKQKIHTFGENYKESHAVNANMATSCSALNVPDANASHNDMSRRRYENFLMDLWTVHTRFMEYMMLINFTSIPDIRGFLITLKPVMKRENIQIPTVKPIVGTLFKEDVSKFQKRACTYMLILKYQEWVERTNRELRRWS